MYRSSVYSSSIVPGGLDVTSYTTRHTLLNVSAMDGVLGDGRNIPVDLVDDPVHDPLEEVPGEVESLGRHVVRRCHGTEDDDLADVSDSTMEKRWELGVAYEAIDSLVSHHTHRAAGVDGGIGC